MSTRRHHRDVDADGDSGRRGFRETGRETGREEDREGETLQRYKERDRVGEKRIRVLHTPYTALQGRGALLLPSSLVPLWEILSVECVPTTYLTYICTYRIPPLPYVHYSTYLHNNLALSPFIYHTLCVGMYIYNSYPYAHNFFSISPTSSSSSLNLPLSVITFQISSLSSPLLSPYYRNVA